MRTVGHSLVDAKVTHFKWVTVAFHNSLLERERQEERPLLPLLDLDWTSSGPPAGPRLDIYWTYDGPLLDLHWAFTGALLDLY